MQLISATLFVLSLASLLCTLHFVRRWHNANRRTSLLQIMRNEIGHIGISAIVEYPDTPAPLLALLEEEYPRSEAIIVTDLEHLFSPFGELISRFHLIKVNHSHLTGVRTLYRSRHRAFRRVVLVDLPSKYRRQATEVAREVASFDYILLLRGESKVARNALAYCANIIASQPATKSITLSPIVGAKARLERADRTERSHTIRLATGRPLAWRKTIPLFLIIAAALPAATTLLAHLSGHRVLLLTAIVISLIFATLIYLSCRVVAEKGLFATINTIIENFCRFLVEDFRKISYLYKGSRRKIWSNALSTIYLLRKRR